VPNRIIIEQVLNWLNALVKAELIALYRLKCDLWGGNLVVYTG